MDSSNPAFGLDIRQAAWRLADELSNTSALLIGFHDAKLNKERITALTIEALTRRCKSPDSTHAAIKNVSELLQFFLDARGEPNPDGVTLTGDSSVVLLRDYLESVSDRGLSVPGAVKTSLITWSEAIGAPWPIDNPLVCAAAQVGSNQVPKHDPPMKFGDIKMLGALSINVEITPIKRSFPSGILLMTYKSLRFSDAQRLRIIEINEDSARGTLPQSKNKKPPTAYRGHGHARAWVLPVQPNGRLLLSSFALPTKNLTARGIRPSPPV